jgi:hypothetical protein
MPRDDERTAFDGIPDCIGPAPAVARGTGEEAPPARPGPLERPWPMLDPAAFYGLPGDVANAIAPHTEADPVAILVQYMAAAGNAIGRGPHYRVEGDRHGPNIFGVLVGETAKGRKGTSWGRVRQVMEIADPSWAAGCIHSGLSSGEGVISTVRDPACWLATTLRG